MTGHELRTLRALRSPTYDGALALILALSAKDTRKRLRSLERQGYVERELGIGSRTWKLTEKGVEIVEAMTP